MPFISDGYFIVLENNFFLCLIEMIILLVTQILFYFYFLIFIDFKKIERSYLIINSFNF